MANLIDTSFFVGEINIPNTQKPEISQKINLFISQYEPEILEKLFGEELYDLFVSNPEEERFLKLKNGDGKWKGLVYGISSDPVIKISLIAYYVYYHFIRDDAIWYSGTGAAATNKKDAVSQSPSLKMVNAWNKMSMLICNLYNYIDSSKEVYPEWVEPELWRFAKINSFDI